MVKFDAETKSRYWLTVCAQDHGNVPLHSCIEVRNLCLIIFFQFISVSFIDDEKYGKAHFSMMKFILLAIKFVNNSTIFHPKNEQRVLQILRTTRVVKNRGEE